MKIRGAHRNNARLADGGRVRRALGSVADRVAVAGVPAFTRQGAMAAARAGSVARATAASTARAVAPARPAAWLAGGVLLLGTGVALLIRAELGLPPYDVFLSTLSDRLGTTHGRAGWVVGASLMAVAAVLGRLPRASTVGFVVSAGLVIDTALPLLDTPTALSTRLVMAVFGTTLVGAGISVVVHGGNTGGPLELVVRAIADRGPGPSRIRTLFEVAIMVAGVALGGPFGPATVVFAIVLGPLVVHFEQALSDFHRGRRARTDRSATTERRPEQHLVGASAGTGGDGARQHG